MKKGSCVIKKIAVILLLLIIISVMPLTAGTGAMGNDPRFQAPSSSSTNSNAGSHEGGEGNYGGGGTGISYRTPFSSYFGAIQSLLQKGIQNLSISRNKASATITAFQISTYNALKTVAEKITAKHVGDPVLLTSGSYIQREEDISLRTYAGRIVINRIYISGKGTGGGMGGPLWTLSTEERIIRGYTTGAEEAAGMIEGSLAELNVARKEAEEAWSKKDEYEADEPFTTEFEGEIKQAGETAAEAEREIKRYRAIAEKAEKLKGLNRYSSYGEVSKNEGTGNDSLILVLEGYIPVVFDYKGEGKWEAHEKKYRNEYSLESRNGKDALEANGFM